MRKRIEKEGLTCVRCSGNVLPTLTIADPSILIFLYRVILEQSKMGVYASAAPARPSNFMKHKLKGNPENGGQVRTDQVLDHTQVSGSRSKCKGGSGAMVPRPFRLKFGGEMGTHPGRPVPMFGWVPLTPVSGALKMGFWGTICPNYE